VVARGLNLSSRVDFVIINRVVYQNLNQPAQFERFLNRVNALPCQLKSNKLLRLFAYFFTPGGEFGGCVSVAVSKA
jgi:hypothetical protein